MTKDTSGDTRHDPPVPSDTEEEDVFHDARFPPDEESVCDPNTLPDMHSQTQLTTYSVSSKSPTP